MELHGLSLSHFRNYSKRTFTFSKNTTVFVGPNAIGKTNILEAIFILAVGKSFRTERDSEAVENGEEIAQLKSQITNFNDQLQLEVMVTHGTYEGQKIPIKKYLVNGVSRRMIDFVGNLKVVLFEPEDVELIRGSPSKKRNYFDFVLIQVDREYRRCLAAYEKGVRQRNRLLQQIRDEGANEQQLYFWNHVIIKNGHYLHSARENFISYINMYKSPFGIFNVVYDHSSISEERLTQYHNAEIASATTLVGPHRDNFEVFDEKRSLASFGSRGEQRLGVLWLKLAELAFIEEKTQERPLLLLDDIFSELDHEHQAEVLGIVNKQQTIMTTTDAHFVPENMITDIEMVKLT